MANTTADKLAHLEKIKQDMKVAINGSGSTVGDKFADYPGAVNDFRSKVATAITEKGVATNATDTPDQMAANIGAIESGGEGLLIPNTVSFQKLFNPLLTTQSIVTFLALLAPAMIKARKTKLVEYNIHNVEFSPDYEPIISGNFVEITGILSKYTDVTQISDTDLRDLDEYVKDIANAIALSAKRSGSSWLLLDGDKIITKVEPV